MGWHKTCRPEIPPKMLGLGYDLCFFEEEDTSLTGALIEVLGVSLMIRDMNVHRDVHKMFKMFRMFIRFSRCQ